MSSVLLSTTTIFAENNSHPLTESHQPGKTYTPNKREFPHVRNVFSTLPEFDSRFPYSLPVWKRTYNRTGIPPSFPKSNSPFSSSSRSFTRNASASPFIFDSRGNPFPLHWDSDFKERGKDHSSSPAEIAYGEGMQFRSLPSPGGYRRQHSISGLGRITVSVKLQLLLASRVIWSSRDCGNSEFSEALSCEKKKCYYDRITLGPCLALG